MMNYKEIERRIMDCQSSELDLSEYSLVDDDVAKMVPTINQRNNITNINFSFNNLSSEVFKSLLQLLHVKELNLANNNITLLDDQLITSKKFTAVNLRSNNIPANCVENFLNAQNNQCGAVQFGFEGNPCWKNSLPKTLKVIAK